MPVEYSRRVTLPYSLVLSVFNTLKALCLSSQPHNNNHMSSTQSSTTSSIVTPHSLMQLLLWARQACSLVEAMRPIGFSTLSLPLGEVSNFCRETKD